MDKTEKKFENRVIQEVSEAGIPYLAINSVQRRGVPDLHLTYEGHSVWLELKTSGRYDGDTVDLNHDLSAVQSKTLRDFGQSGALSGVLCGISPEKQVFTPHFDLSPGPHGQLEVQTEFESVLSWLRKHFATSSDP